MSFSRLIQLIGNERYELIKQTTVAIVGLGGVGGHAAEAIARSAFSKLILVDPDIIEDSNLNRQLIALHSTVGERKVDVMEQRIKDINPACEVIKLPMFYKPETRDRLFEHKIDFIIDAIDMIPFKADLIASAHERHIDIISVMGTGRKQHPEQLALTTLAKTAYDPVARTLRQRLKDVLDLRQVMVISSTEPPKDLDSTDNGPCSNAFVPATAGILAANYVYLKTIGNVT